MVFDTCSCSRCRFLTSKAHKLTGMAPAAAMLAAARSTGLGLITHIPPAAPVAKTHRDRHDRAPHLVALTGCRRIMKVLPALLWRRMGATTDHRGPVADRAGRVVRLPASVGVSDILIVTALLLLYGGSTTLLQDALVVAPRVAMDDVATDAEEGARHLYKG